MPEIWSNERPSRPSKRCVVLSLAGRQRNNRRNRQNRAKQGGTMQNKGGTHWIEADQKGYLVEHFGKISFSK
eukprot:scaffold91636_cov36-Cyclotella_meneghiniana.AAC.6